MDDTFWHHKTLLRHQFYNFVFKIYKELALENEKEFVIIVMLVPMVLALHDSESNHRIVNFGKSLVVPLIGACFDQDRGLTVGWILSALWQTRCMRKAWPPQPPRSLNTLLNVLVYQFH